MFARAAAAGLMSVGVDVVDLGVVPTPTVQLAVEHHHAGAGLILTASHNPIEWNALKFVGPGRDLSRRRRRASGSGRWPSRGRRASGVGRDRRAAGGPGGGAPAPRRRSSALPVIDVAAIRGRRFHVALDCVRGAGAVAILPLLERLGCRVSGINLEPDGRFPAGARAGAGESRRAGRLVRESGADLGLAVDPDVDRLAVVDETGRAIGEDYTLAFAVRAVLDGRSNPAANPTVVVNLSTSLVVEDAATRSRRHAGARTGRRGQRGPGHTGARRGDRRGRQRRRHVPCAAHRARRTPGGGLDLASPCHVWGNGIAELVASSPRYTIVKAKGPRAAELGPLYDRLRRRFADAATDDRDGLRLSWADRWLHIRPSGTEPIVRLIAEAPTAAEAEALVAAGENSCSEEHGAMCGIVGYIGPRQAADLLIEGLRRLEYRGYDSSGHRGGQRRRAQDQEGGGQALRAGAGARGRHAGRHASASATPAGPPTARRPRPTRIPHTDQSGRIAVIHNGIIENSAAIRKTLERRGHSFKSETDTEVLAHLVGEYYDGNLEEAVAAALREVDGAYGLAFISADEPGVLVAARKGSPAAGRRGRERVVRRLGRVAAAAVHPLGGLPRRRRDGGAHPRRLPGAEPGDRRGSASRSTRSTGTWRWWSGTASPTSC